MRIFFHKISDKVHEVAVERPDGSRESRRLESKSLLKHDFIHLALEQAAGLAGGFWGRLAAGASFTDLDHEPTDYTNAIELDDLAVIERIAGAMHRIDKLDDPASLVAGLHSQVAAIGPVPDWLTAPLVAATKDRLRRLMGHWKATGYGQIMEVEWSEPTA